MASYETIEELKKLIKGKGLETQVKILEVSIDARYKAKTGIQIEIDELEPILERMRGGIEGIQLLETLKIG